MKSKWLVNTVLAGMAVALAGCGASGDSKPSKTEEAQKPVTLSIYMTQVLNDDEFKELLVEPVQKKYPYISIEKMEVKSIEDAMAAGSIPDLITVWNGQLLPYKRNGLLEDITPHLKTNNIDLNRFTPVTLEPLRLSGDNPNELYGLPYFTQFNALYYNKDLFDRFGVDYPKDGMTWEDAIEVAKKMSRVDGGTQYRGLDYENIQRIAFPLSVNYIDHKTNKANVNSDTWRLAFQTAKSIVTIPNNMQKTLNSGSATEFFINKTVAMFASFNHMSTIKTHIDNGLNVGIAQYPSYKGRPNVYGLADSNYMLISKQSKNKDAAAKVLGVLLSDEIQLIAASKYARQSPLSNPEFKTKFGSEVPYLKGISLQSIFKSNPAPGAVFPTLYNQVNPIVAQEYIKYAKDEQDLNTALKTAEDKINALIEAEKMK